MKALIAMNQRDCKGTMRGLVLIALASLVTQNGAAQDAPKSVQDPQIAAAWRQISAQRVQADIEKLASFRTRLTLSAQDPASIAADAWK